MDSVSIYAVSLINLFVAARSWVLIYKKRIQPSLAMWLFFLIAISVSLITYLKDGDFRFQDNILNVADLFMAGSIVICILLFGEKSTRFNRFDTFCLSFVMVILFFWIITRNHFISNILMQLIMVIAYFPTYNRLIITRKNSESFTVWISMLTASLVALISTKGLLAQIYVWRAIICIVFLLGFMTWLTYSQVINKKNRR